MSKQRAKFYIKERHNPQLGIYYVKMGRMSKAEARRAEKSLYGSNVMFSYDTEGEYEEASAEFEKAGSSVHVSARA